MKTHKMNRPIELLLKIHKNQYAHITFIVDAIEVNAGLHLSYCRNGDIGTRTIDIVLMTKKEMRKFKCRRRCEKMNRTKHD